MDDVKYKLLRSKHNLLKDAFKRLYCDYETLKGDLSSKIEEYAKLHEENTHLKHSYDLLSDEVSSQNQKPLKTGASSWANPLTLIKGVQSSPNDGENCQKLNEEISLLKSKLDASIRENELLQAQNLQTTRDLEDTKAKNNVVVSELKDRLIALESILKDLQDQSNKNEIKLSKFCSEIKALNLEIESKSNEIATLNRSLENQKREHEKDSLQWKLQLKEKFKFDLRRNCHFNTFNIYQESCDLDTFGDTLSTKELFKALLSSFLSFFQAHLSSMKFIPSSRLYTSDSSSESDSPSRDQSQDSLTFSSLFPQENSHVAKNMDSLVDQINDLTLKMVQNVESILSKMDENHLLDLLQCLSVSNLVENLKRFFRLQRVYFCVEEYLVPYEFSLLSKTQDHGTLQLIKLLGTFSRIVSKFRLSLRSILFLSSLKRSCLSQLLRINLDKEFNSENKSDSVVYDRYRDEMNCVNLLLQKTSNKLFSLVKQISAMTNEFKEFLSHRTCYPKVVNGMFLPLTGGTNQIVHLTSCLTKFEDNLAYLNEFRVKSYLNYLCSSVKIASSTGEFGLENCSVESHPAISYLKSSNSRLLSSQPRIKLSNLERDLQVARMNENELSDLKLKFSEVEEMLTISTMSSERYKNELESFRQGNNLEMVCSKIFSSLEKRYETYSLKGQESCTSQLECELEEANNRIKRLVNHTKHLVKTVSSLEDSNNQLKLALELNNDKYRLTKENEDAIHRNYNDQLVLMSEHISELNNAILASEYKIAELTQTKVSCPSCGFNNTLGLFKLLNINFRLHNGS